MEGDFPPCIMNIYGRASMLHVPTTPDSLYWPPDASHGLLGLRTALRAHVPAFSEQRSLHCASQRMLRFVGCATESASLFFFPWAHPHPITTTHHDCRHISLGPTIDVLLCAPACTHAHNPIPTACVDTGAEPFCATRRAASSSSCTIKPAITWLPLHACPHHLMSAQLTPAMLHERACPLQAARSCTALALKSAPASPHLVHAPPLLYSTELPVLVPSSQAPCMAAAH